MAEAGAPKTAEAVIAEARAPEVTEAIVMVARPSVQEAEMQAAEASAVPLAQGPPLLRESARETEVYPISSDDTSRVREVVGAEETDVVEQPAPLLDEGSSALMRVRPKPRGYCGRAGTTLWGSLCSPLRTRPRGALGLLRAISPAGRAVAAYSVICRG